MCRSSCSLPKEKPSIRYPVWSSVQDYIIHLKELVARVGAVLRRFKVKQPAANPSEKCVSYPDLMINLTNYSVTYMGNHVDMPPKELELLYFLAASPNQVFTKSSSGL